MFISVNKPVDECTGKLLVLILKRKEKLDTPDFHALHSRLRIVSDNKHSVTAGMAKEAGC
jgi:hypothetical protein